MNSRTWMSFHPVHPGASFGTPLKNQMPNKEKDWKPWGLRDVRCHLDVFFHGSFKVSSRARLVESPSAAWQSTFLRPNSCPVNLSRNLLLTAPGHSATARGSGSMPGSAMGSLTNGVLFQKLEVKWHFQDFNLSSSSECKV